MKSIKVNEVLNFDRSSKNPLDSLNIGRIEERAIENFMNGVEKLGINIIKKSSALYPNGGVWEFYLKDKKHNIDYESLYYIYFTTEKCAKEEDWGDEFGFYISKESDGQTLLGPTMDWQEPVKFIKNELFRLRKLRSYV